MLERLPCCGGNALLGLSDSLACGGKLESRPCCEVSWPCCSVPCREASEPCRNVPCWDARLLLLCADKLLRLPCCTERPPCELPAPCDPIAPGVSEEEKCSTSKTPCASTPGWERCARRPSASSRLTAAVAAACHSEHLRGFREWWVGNAVVEDTAAEVDAALDAPGPSAAEAVSLFPREAPSASALASPFHLGAGCEEAPATEGSETGEGCWGTEERFHVEQEGSLEQRTPWPAMAASHSLLSFCGKACLGRLSIASSLLPWKRCSGCC
mmetsp:Transcript_54143/g.107532  ORF Transcript_54143/g.107532 Transcript_54143/m.107532 type:complete len:270 (-) Transcript_54143:1229-2038(-)